MKSNEYPMYVVMLSNFGHDTNGNPIAEHAVYGYASAEQDTAQPTDRLYETPRRKQVGFSDRCDEYAFTALGKAKARNDLKLVRFDGSRSEGFMKLVYT